MLLQNADVEIFLFTFTLHVIPIVLKSIKKTLNVSSN